MTTTKRITVTLPVDILAAIQTEAGGNVSAYTAKALKAQAVRDAADRLAAWQAGHVDMTEDLQAVSFDTLDDLPGGGQ
ncbi:hypothetical protein [Streptomyces boninensis]|uniref:hypothetical protein n=1 Tax=Streptomyces boninensis TaxID=2039455 RepID=UPI003B220DD0